MKPLSRTTSREVNLLFLLLAIFWIIVLLSSLTWNIAENRRATKRMALVHARESFRKDVLARRWNASHGGVYAPVTEKTQPNPYLTTVQERDITTVSGRKLTMINPAYMTRQLYELALATHNISGHITSLDPIRPENKPDDWEAMALKSFENGEKEVHAIIERNGGRYLRLMRPLITEKSCLKCHAQQGYSVGNVRGGISVIVPLPKTQMSWHSNTALLGGHFLLLIMGLLALVFGNQRIINAIRQRQQAENGLAEANQNLETKVVERTAEYRKVNEQLQNEIIERSEVQHEREQLIKKLQIALEEVKTLRGILPICSYCKKIRNTDGEYEQIDKYIVHQTSGVDFSHTICPECLKKRHPEEYGQMYPEELG